MTEQKPPLRNHTHRWQPGPLLAGYSPTHTGGYSRPTSIVLACKCGQLWTKAIPEVERTEPDAT